jgi:hypothetical protein
MQYVFKHAKVFRFFFLKKIAKITLGFLAICKKKENICFIIIYLLLLF